MVRTTLQLDDQLLSDARVLAACTRRTLSQVIEHALLQALVPEPHDVAPNTVVRPHGRILDLAHSLHTPQR